MVEQKKFSNSFYAARRGSILALFALCACAGETVDPDAITRETKITALSDQANSLLVDGEVEQARALLAALNFPFRQ